jgi:hypothetical protein
MVAGSLERGRVGALEENEGEAGCDTRPKKVAVVRSERRKARLESSERLWKTLREAGVAVAAALIARDVKGAVRPR